MKRTRVRLERWTGIGGVVALAVAGSLGWTRVDTAAPLGQAEDGERPSVLAWLDADGRFNRFLDLLASSGLGDELFAEGPVTLFVPTDAAFANYSDELLAELQARREELGELLRFHALAGRWTLEAFGQKVRVPTLQGENLALRWRGGDEYSVDSAKLLERDVDCADGVVHVLDRLIVPDGSALRPLLLPPQEGPQDYEIDLVHSTVLFRVMHMRVGAVWGWFRTFRGRIVFDEASPENSSIAIEVDVDSLDTGNASRDGYLKTADFFDEPTWPRMTFESRRIERLDDDRFTVTGDLTLRGITREVEFETRKLGEGPFGPDWYKIGFEAELTFLRSDYGMTFGIPDVAGDEVRLVIALEGGRPVEEPDAR